jgi:hypothetical protein
VHASVYVYNVLLYSVYVLRVHKLKVAFARTTKSTLQLRNALCNVAQNVLHIHTFLKSSFFQPRRFNRGNMWMRQSVTRVLAG